MFPYRYYDRATGTFCNLSRLPEREEKALLKGIRIARLRSRTAKRNEQYRKTAHLRADSARGVCPKGRADGADGAALSGACVQPLAVHLV